MRKLLVALLLFAQCLTVAPQAHALQRVKVSRTNISQFSGIASSRFIYCYVKSYKLGYISAGALKIRSSWVETNKKDLGAKIKQLTLRLRTLKGTTKKKSAADLKTLKKILKDYKAYASSCSADTGDGGSFVGESFSLAPYHESLTSSEVQFILDRIAFGGTSTLKSIGVTQGLHALVNALVDGTGVVGNGYEASLSADTTFWRDRLVYRPEDYPSLSVWTTEAVQAIEGYRLLYSEMPFKEWMTLFLHAHFAVNLSKIGASYSTSNHLAIPDYWNLLNDHAFGNFKDLTAQMVDNRAMTAWLNNDDNRSDSPNQNFARELLELFTLGTVDPVTHSLNYGEDTIRGVTAYMSGYYSDWIFGIQPGVETRITRYDASLHDAQPYLVFSGVMGAEINSSFTPAGFIDYLFANNTGVSRYIAEKLFASIAHPDTNEAIVSELSRDLRDNNFEIKPVLKKILLSQAFFSQTSHASCISSPIEETVKLARKIGYPKLPTTGTEEALNTYQWLLLNINHRANDAGQSMFEPNSVFGWKGSCGLNRGGRHAYGESWMGLQKVLGRQNACVGLMNDLMTLDFNFGSLATSANSTPRDLVLTLSSKLLNITPTESQIDILTYFLLHDRDDSGETSIQFNITNSDYRQKKIPRLICLLHELTEARFR